MQFFQISVMAKNIYILLVQFFAVSKNSFFLIWYKL